jgi:hypothetical protein
MHIFNITFQSVTALLAIGVLGFWIIKRHIIPDDDDIGNHQIDRNGNTFTDFFT